jgi:hypothetical protein
VTTLETTLRIIGVLGTWAMIAVYFVLMRHVDKRLDFLEESRMATLTSMAKMLRIIVKMQARESVEPTGGASSKGEP